MNVNNTAGNANWNIGAALFYLKRNNNPKQSCVNASLALGEATARAVQRIPDAHCNGDMHAALDYAQNVKHEQKDFLNEQALKQIV